jgi:hypothetical protein
MNINKNKSINKTSNSKCTVMLAKMPPIEVEEFLTGQVSALIILRAVIPHTMEGILVEAQLITDIMAVDHIMEAIVVGIITRGGVTHIRGGAYPPL